jgi:hypothetical protein
MLYAKRILAIGAAAWLAASLAFQPLNAGDNIEALTTGGTVISHKLWAPSAFPLSWQLSQAGVVNNDVNGNGTPALTNAQASAEIAAAFQLWQDLGLSTIVVAAGGETPGQDIGCDLVNIITWSDTVNPLGPGTSTIARGIATSYVGPAVVLGNLADPNRQPCGAGNGTLPLGSYPVGMTLSPGTIVDMDMTWNSNDFDYVTAPNNTASVVDIRAIAAHEFGHMFGFSHTSMAFTANNPATMFPTVSSTNVTLQNNMRTLSTDEDASAGRGYPDAGFYPAGAGPYTTGSITGHITTPAGAAASGVRVWAYSASSTAQPVYETFSATSFDWDPSLAAGDYVLDGLLPGDYFVCIVAWGNGVPNATASQSGRYNLTTNNGVNSAGFGSECYDDSQTAGNPNFANPDLIRKVTVTAGENAPHIDFVTGADTTDFMLVMDRSGSMLLYSGTPGVTKIDALQNSANMFVDFLDVTGNHRLGLVQFNSALVPLTPEVDLQPLDAGAVTDAHAAINTMSAGGNTNINAGLQEAIDQLTAVASPSPRQVMVVFTDGKHNSPPGTTLASMHDPVVDNDIRFYSIGYGTSVDDAILSGIAHDSGGVHVNEQSLDAIALGKHFLSIAASAADLTTLIDPRYTLVPNETATLNVNVSPDERELTFVVEWAARNRDFASVSIVTPSKCLIPASQPGSGFEVRRGDTYTIVHVPVPYRCRRNEVTAGLWRLSVKASPASSGEAQMSVYGHGAVNVTLDPAMTRFGPMVFARFLRYGRPIAVGPVVGELLRPVKPTWDSTDQDELGSRYCLESAKDMRQQSSAGNTDPRCLNAPDVAPAAKRTVRVALYDDGIHGDLKAGDGVYSTPLPLKEPGTYRLRVLAAGADKGATPHEQWTAFYFDGQRVIGEK